MLTAFLPLVVIKGLISPFTFSKVFVFSILVFISFVFFIFEFIKNKKYKVDFFERINVLAKNKVFISVTFFVIISGVSVIFAEDKYLAFWGNIERSEGFIGLITLYSFFFLSVVSFKKEHWLWFFKLSVITSIIILMKAFFQFIDGEERVRSYMGNAAFLAGYLLFSVTSSWIVIKETRDTLWKYILPLVGILAVVGIFLTETRGTLLGLFVAVILSIFLFISKKEVLIWRKINIKKILVIFLIFCAIFSGVFILTRKSDLWQSLPGFSRIANISLEDDTTRSRLLIWQTSIDSVNPSMENNKKFLIGWGLENSRYALDKYYNIELYNYDEAYFDRSHNKFLDTLVMSGVFGILAYFSIWISFFFLIYKRRSGNVDPLFFFGTSFLVHLMFLFDQFPTSLSFFAIMSYSIFYFYETEESKKQYVKDNKLITTIVLFILLLLNIFVLFFGSLPSYIHNKKYISIMKSQNATYIKENISSVFTPFTYVQSSIRSELLNTIKGFYGDAKKDDKKLADVDEISYIAITAADDYLLRRPEDYRFYRYILAFYSSKAASIGDEDSFNKSEQAANNLLKYIPDKPNASRSLAMNFGYRGKYKEGLDIMENLELRGVRTPEFYYDYGYLYYFYGNYEHSLLKFEKSFILKDDLFAKKKESNLDIYNNLLLSFYANRDKDNFITAGKRLLENGYNKITNLQEIISNVENDKWIGLKVF